MHLIRLFASTIMADEAAQPRDVVLNLAAREDRSETPSPRLQS